MTRPANPQPLDHLPLRGAPDAAAVVLKDGALDYAALELWTGRLAAWLVARSRAERWERGARVASWAGKGLLTCLMPLAAPRAGLVHVPVNPVLKRAQVEHILADSGARLLIGNSGRLAALHDGDLPADCKTLDEKSVIEQAEDCDPIGPSSADPDTLAAILYTSGSTGRPKGVMLSHANMWLGAESVAEYLGITPEDRVLAVLPLAFDYGQNQLLSTWYAGAAVVPVDYLLPREVVKAVEARRITTLAAVPPLWVQLLEQEWPEAAAASLRRLTNTGGALGEVLVRRLRAQFPDARLFAMYGLTEAFRSACLDPDLIDSHPTSFGKAVPHVEIMVVNDDGHPARPGEEGELVHAGPFVAQGYWQDPERTKERFRPAPAWSEYGGIAVWSGDRVTRDKDGLLYFVGRRDAMIKVLGQRVSPQEIEDAAMGTGLVAECVAIGLPDENLGQAVHLVARAAPDGDPEPTEALIAALRRELPAYMLPQVVHWRETLARGATGKLDRAGLRRELEDAQ